ncbi:aminomethyl-transferring glycine dehydrogenase subunit GcvPA [Pseudoduganella violaceinigra]|uniref:aminomethyl-transferring glycine dehydrogenase subunit GcvPA n=1 Tax=Pseudoduganella violaceinigra TaxID=246602 RepID=UPI000413B9A8|nr:aminomethyl-transferring glycine dehydrogenase subunit GcvPA [Pseudoduganella violaceinigra]
MEPGKPFTHPYIPNSVPAVRDAMLQAVGAASTEDFFADIPAALRMQAPLALPAPHLSEARLKRHVDGLLRKNAHCATHLSFLGGGCYQHHVPSICDEINGRSEFATAYAGEPYDDHGRFQALFEYCSMMGALLEMDVVNVPVYDGMQAAATAVRMAGRLTGRRRVVVAGHINPDKLSVMYNYGRADLDFVSAPFGAKSGLLDIGAVSQLLDQHTAAVYVDIPSFLGTIDDGAALAAAAHAVGALFVVGVDPVSLGVLAPPASYGADIVCGDIQPLGMHMNYGGGQGGFIASHDDPAIVMQYPSRLFGIVPTSVPGEYGFGDVAYSRTSFDKRENGNEFVGTAAALWGITAGVFLALMGPQGMGELASGIAQRTAYAKQRIARLPGVRIAHGGSSHFREFVVDFNGTGLPVGAINAALLKNGIFGGHDLGSAFPALGQCALYAFSEVHTQEDIDLLCATLEKAIQQ